MGNPVNKIAQASIKDHVALSFADLANINNPSVGSMAYVKDSSITYVYRGALPTPEIGPYSWEQYVDPSTGGSDDQTASEVPFTPTGNTSSTDVQAAIEELQVDIDNFVDTDNQIASEVPFTPTGNISATDVQAAIQEVNDERVAGSGTVVDNSICIHNGTTGDVIEGSPILINTDGSWNIPIFTTAKVGSVAGDFWCEKVGSGPTFLKINVAGTDYCVELSA